MTIEIPRQAASISQVTRRALVDMHIPVTRVTTRRGTYAMRTQYWQTFITTDDGESVVAALDTLRIGQSIYWNGGHTVSFLTAVPVPEHVCSHHGHYDTCPA
jgi:hypothetical protein